MLKILPIEVEIKAPVNYRVGGQLLALKPGDRLQVKANEAYDLIAGGYAVEVRKAEVQTTRTKKGG